MTTDRKYDIAGWLMLTMIWVLAASLVMIAVPGCTLSLSIRPNGPPHAPKPNYPPPYYPQADAAPASAEKGNQ